MAGSRHALKEAPHMSYRMAGRTWSGTIPWIKPASRPQKGGFKQAAESITWGVRGSLAKDRDFYLPGSLHLLPAPQGPGPHHPETDRDHAAARTDLPRRTTDTGNLGGTPVSHTSPRSICVSACALNVVSPI